MSAATAPSAAPSTKPITTTRPMTGVVSRRWPVSLTPGGMLTDTIQAITALGRKAGVSLNPGTPAKMLDYLIDEVDLVLVMSVNPGFGGQGFIAGQLRKIEAVRTMIAKSGRDIRLEVDGGINPETARQCVAAGADVLVAGSSSFAGGPARYAGNIAALRGLG